MRPLVLLVVLCAAAQCETRRYWVEPCTRPETQCRPGDAELARWAMEAWQAASGGALTLQSTDDPEKAHIRFRWAGQLEGLYGEARPIEVDGKTGAEIFVRPSVVPPGTRDALLRESIVFLSCVHESGHALGLPHTAQFDDIMYSFQYGGDITEYFARYRRRLKTRDDIRRHDGMSAADRARLRQIYP